MLAGSIRPATNVVIAIVSVDAARLAPILSHRFLPWEEDFNRCFSQPTATNPGTSQRRLAADLLARLTKLAPEAIVDTHNTSAHSEPFAVAIRRCGTLL